MLFTRNGVVSVSIVGTEPRGPGKTKSVAGMRLLALPPFMRSELKLYLELYGEKAAMTYQHSDTERQCEVAKKRDDQASGLERARDT